MKSFKWVIVLCISVLACRNPKHSKNESNYHDFKYMSFITNKNVIYDKNIPKIYLDSSEIEISKILNKSTWIWLLKSDTSDFAASIVLYQVFKPDTVFNCDFETKKYWKNCQKKEDIKLWKKTIENDKKQD